MKLDPRTFCYDGTNSIILVTAGSYAKIDFNLDCPSNVGLSGRAGESLTQYDANIWSSILTLTSFCNCELISPNCHYPKILKVKGVYDDTTTRMARC